MQAATALLSPALSSRCGRRDSPGRYARLASRNRERSAELPLSANLFPPHGPSRSSALR